MAEYSSQIAVRPAGRGWPRWLAALLVGVLLLLTLLIASWFLRACAPVDPSMNLTALETPAPPAPPPPHRSDIGAEGLARRRGGRRKEAQGRARSTAGRPQEQGGAVQAGRAAQAAAAAAGRQGAAATAAVAGRPMGAKGPRHAAGLLAARPRYAGQHRHGRAGPKRAPSRPAGSASRATEAGERQTTAVCPGTGTVTCTAPITARFGNDTSLGTTQPAVRCNPTGTSWNGPPNSLTCRRVSDVLAICRDRLNFEHEFRRE